MMVPTTAAAIADEIRAALNRCPRQLPSRYFYDDRGSSLFETISRLPEYYLTRAETEILRRNAPEIMSRARPETLVELGSGSCEKTRMLIDAGREAGGLRRFHPFDISAAALASSELDLARAYPWLEVKGVNGDFMRPSGLSMRHGRTLIAFLGSTLGNLDRDERSAFFQRVRAAMHPGDSLLLGIDLVKDEATLNAAYNDSRGVTAEFNLNLLRVLNRELGADFDLNAFEHVAFYNPSEHRIEMWLRAVRRMQVRLPAARLELLLGEGEMIRTEISVKFTPDLVTQELRESELCLDRWYTDAASRFGLALAVAR